MTTNGRNRRASRAAPLFASVAMGCALAGCGGGGGGGDGGGTNREVLIQQAVDAAGKVQPLGPTQDSITSTDVRDEGDYQNTYEQHDAIANLEGVAYLGLNDDIVWPGSLVSGEHLHQFVYAPVTLPRGPMTLSVSLESAGGTGNLSLVVTDAKLSTIRQGIRDLLAQSITPGTTIPAKVDYREQRVSNVSHMNMFLGADVSYGSGSLSTRFDWSSAERKNKILAKYTQIYYTVDVDPPNGAAALFGPGVTPEQVAAAMPPGSRPVYVASVAYGMMAILCIETDFTAEEMGAALNAAWNGAFEAQVAAGYTARKVLEQSSITVIVYGGSTKGLQDVETGFAGFQKVLDASKEFGPDTPGVPIMYKFRHLSDNTLAQVSLTSQYTVVRSLQLRQRIEVVVDKFVCTEVDDEAGGLDIRDVTVWVNAFQRAAPGSAAVRVNPVDQVIYDWPGGEFEMHVGGELAAGSSVILEFDTVNYDFSLATIQISGHAMDYDVWSANDWATGYLPVASSQLNLGTSRVMFLAGNGMGIQTHLRLLDATR